MKKLLVLVAAFVLISVLAIGSSVMAKGDDQDKVSPWLEKLTLMENGSGNVLVTYIPEDFPQFVSPEYPQMRHISVTIFPSTNMSAGDSLYVRANFFKENGDLAAKVPVLALFDIADLPKTVEFDATQWEIIGNDADNSLNFTVYFNYTMTYTNTIP
jgi:hypothetical protein